MSVTQTSKETFLNKENQKKMATHRKSIETFLMTNQDYPYTAKAMSKMIGISYTAIQRRISEILDSGKVIIVKVVQEDGVKVQQYQWNKDNIKQERKPTKFERLCGLMKHMLDQDQYRDIMRTFNKKD